VSHQFPPDDPDWQVFRPQNAWFQAGIRSESAISPPEYLPISRLETARREIGVSGNLTLEHLTLEH
jgi:hypothetical protein